MHTTMLTKGFLLILGGGQGLRSLALLPEKTDYVLSGTKDITGFDYLPPGLGSGYTPSRLIRSR